jgi:hypothetical protein
MADLALDWVEEQSLWWANPFLCILTFLACGVCRMTTNHRTLDVGKGLEDIDVEAAKRDDRDPERWANFRKQT